MNAQDPLAQLRGIHLPEPVSIWPPAPGWWILGLLIIACLFVLFRLVRLVLKKQRAKQQLRKLFIDIENQWQKDQDKRKLLHDISDLLRRLLLLQYPREEVATLSGENWLKKLDEISQTDNFTNGAGKILGSGLYAENADFDAEELLKIVKSWLEPVYRKIDLKGLQT